MSLINDALKDAQQKRSGPVNPVDLPPMPGSSSGHHAVKSGTTPPEKKMTILVASFVGVLIAVVLLMGHFLRREEPEPRRVASKPAARPAAAKPAAHPPAEGPAPMIVAPVIKVAPVAVEPAPPTTSPAPAPLTAAAAPAVPPKPAPAASAPVEQPPPGLLAPGQDIRVLTYIDALRVAGIRSSGDGSKVLMNDKVYRVNDIVDYTLGIRLTKVAADGLTFTDANGTTYVKTF